MTIYAANLKQDHVLDIVLKKNRCGYLQVAKGEVLLDDEALSAGDAAKLDGATNSKLTARKDAELIFFDLPSIG